MSLAGQIVYSTAVSDVNDKLMDFCCFLLFSAISMILLKKLCQFCATWVKSSAFCIYFWHFWFIQLWNSTNFSNSISVQNRFFLAMLRQYDLLSRHLLVYELRQNCTHHSIHLLQANTSPITLKSAPLYAPLHFMYGLYQIFFILTLLSSRLSSPS